MQKLKLLLIAAPLSLFSQGPNSSLGNSFSNLNFNFVSNVNNNSFRSNVVVTSRNFSPSGRQVSVSNKPKAQANVNPKPKTAPAAQSKPKPAANKVANPSAVQSISTPVLIQNDGSKNYEGRNGLANIQESRDINFDNNIAPVVIVQKQEDRGRTKEIEIQRSNESFDLPAVKNLRRLKKQSVSTAGQSGKSNFKKWLVKQGRKYSSHHSSGHTKRIIDRCFSWCRGEA